MFKRKKKKTGCETPEFRSKVPMPPVKPPKPPTSGSNAQKSPNIGSSVQRSKQLCSYETPCGWCTKWDKKCDKKIGCEKPDESLEQLSIEDWYDWDAMSPMQREDAREYIKIYNKWYGTNFKDPTLVRIKSGKGLSPLDTEKTETPGIRKEIRG